MLHEKLRFLRLEVALLVDSAPGWVLVDWIRYQHPVPDEMVRVVQRFHRIVGKLQSQRGGRGPGSKYSECLGVRLRVNLETAGVYIVGPHAQKLATAPVLKTGAEGAWLTILGRRSRAAQSATTPSATRLVSEAPPDVQPQADEANGVVG